jgi:hypothetical protein
MFLLVSPEVSETELVKSEAVKMVRWMSVLVTESEAVVDLFGDSKDRDSVDAGENRRPTARVQSEMSFAS